MTSLSNGTDAASKPKSLEPSDAWIGLDAKKAPKARRSAKPTGRGVRRPQRNILKYLTIALLVGGAGAYAAGGGLDLTGQNAEEAAQSAPAGQPTAAPKPVAIADVEAKRKALLAEVEQLEKQRSAHQGEVTELSDRRSSLNQELTELERQRQKVAGIDSVVQPSLDANSGGDVPMDGEDDSVAKAAAAKAQAEAKAKAEAAAVVLEEERKAKVEALAAVQRKEEEAQKRMREVRERKAAAEREIAANRRREREAEARLQQEAASRLALGDTQPSRRAAPLPLGPNGAEEEDENIFGGPVAGFARQQRSSYLPVPVASRFAAPAIAPSTKRVFVHFSVYDPNGRAKAYATARRLQSQGFAVAELRPVKARVSGNSVRFFHEEDRTAVPALRGAVSRSVAQQGGASGTAVQDFRHYDRPPSEGTLEVWLAE